MVKNVLFILSSYNRFSGTPKKIFELIKYSENNNYLYVWSTAYQKEFKEDFKKESNKVFEGNYGRNFIKHVNSIIEIIDNHQIEIVQTHFFFGEFLIGLVKKFRPQIKVVVSFEGSKSSGYFKRILQRIFYKKFDSFIYISNYVKLEKEKVFSQLKKANAKVIYNGSAKLPVDSKVKKLPVKVFNLLSVSSLISIKNLEILLDMMLLFKKENHLDIHLYIAGSGVLREVLEEQVLIDELSNNVHFLGSQKRIGNLLHVSDVLVHPCYIEAFGLSVIEAMMAEVPVVVANAGAFPEIIKHKKTGFLVDPFDAGKWKQAILKLKNDKKLSDDIAKNGKLYAEKHFSIEKYIGNMKKHYSSL